MKCCLVVALCAAATLVAGQENSYNVTEAENECFQEYVEFGLNFTTLCPVGNLDMEMNVSFESG